MCRSIFDDFTRLLYLNRTQVTPLCFVCNQDQTQDVDQFYLNMMGLPGFEPGFNGFLEYFSHKPLVIVTKGNLKNCCFCLLPHQATLRPQGCIYKYCVGNESILKGLWLEVRNRLGGKIRAEPKASTELQFVR